jgi:outer membrane protein assembly factor BamB
VTEFEQRRLWMFAVIMLVGAVIFAVNRLAPAAAPAPAIVDVPAPADLGIGDTALSPAQLGESSSSDWAMEGQNPARTRSTPAALNLPLTMQRTIGGARGDDGGSPPVIARGVALIELNDTLQAIDIASGRERWTYAYRGVYVSPAIAGDQVIVKIEAANEGRIVALDLDSGAERWSYVPRRLSSAASGYTGGHLTAPLISDGVVYVAAGQELYALDLATGAERWVFALQDLVVAAPALDGEQIFISDFAFTYALDRRTGGLAWAQATTPAIHFAPVIAGQLVFIASDDELVALQRNDGTTAWKVAITGESLVPAGAADGQVFAKSTTALYAFDVRDGRQTWSHRDLNFVSLPAVDTDRVFIVSGMGAATKIEALDTTSGERVWSTDVASLAPTAPVIAGRAIYVRQSDGQVVSFWG